MAATKKSLEIREKKNALRAQIVSLEDDIKRACNRVPEWVISGSQQVAVDCRTLAERLYHRISGPPRRATLGELEWLLRQRNIELSQLTRGAL